MPLDTTPVGPVIPVSDLDQARGFYEETLGLNGRETPGGFALDAGGESAIYLLEAPTAAGTADWPLASFRVEDIGSAVEDLRERGVTFMRDDELPFDVDERGISAQDGMRVAWMRDPDGQVVTLFELR